MPFVRHPVSFGSGKVEPLLHREAKVVCTVPAGSVIHINAMDGSLLVAHPDREPLLVDITTGEMRELHPQPPPRSKIGATANTSTGKG